MKDWEAMEETDMIFEKIYNRALARLQKRVKGRAPCGVWGRAPGSFVFPNTKRAVRRVTPRRTALLYKSDFFVSKAVYASASAASFMEKFKRPCLSISISFTITLSPTVSTSSTFATRLLEILEI